LIFRRIEVDKSKYEIIKKIEMPSMSMSGRQVGQSVVARQLSATEKKTKVVKGR
jgi:hypothetical protein